MANPKHLATLRQGVKTWNKWRIDLNEEVNPHSLERRSLPSRVNLDGVDLSEAGLRGLNLYGVNLSGGDLGQTNLMGAKLGDADLSGVNLRLANLTQADLRRANLIEADFSDAELIMANLLGADLTRAFLRGADVTKAVVGFTSFGSIDLSQVKGLSSVQHYGPSTIGIDTIYKSKGDIPEAFLRGAGVPEQFITYARSLVGQAIEFYSCFINYSSEDQAFTERFYTDLCAKDVRVWFAQEDLKTGDRFQERIEELIRLYEKVMIVLSEASVKSRWVEREVNAAREREDREKRTVLFPIRIDDAVMDAPQPWAADIRRSRHIGDFRRWKDHDSYQKALGTLLRDLRADPTAENGRTVRGQTD